MSVSGTSHDDYVTDSNSAMHLGLIRNSDDILSESCTFQPSFSHQIFSAQETIYGYKNLEVKLFYSAGFLNAYLGIKFEDEVTSRRGNDAEPDNIEEILKEKLGITFDRNLDEFQRKLEEESRFKPIGNQVHTVKVAEESGERSYLFYYGDITTPGLVAYHQKLETFAFWFIDAASAIDTDDDKWRFFYVFEKFQSSSGEERYGVVGYATVYEYWAFPEHIRPRISQMLVLPPFQRQGIGTELLRTIYAHYNGNKSVRDITVEDSSDEMQSLRDFLDCQNLMELPEIKTETDLTFELVWKAAQKFHINKMQARRVYEILLLQRTQRSDPVQYEAYRLKIKSRLNGSHQSKLKQLKILEAVIPKEVAEIKTSLTLAEGTRIQTLTQLYNDLEAQYDRVISRLAMV